MLLDKKQKKVSFLFCDIKFLSFLGRIKYLVKDNYYRIWILLQLKSLLYICFPKPSQLSLFRLRNPCSQVIGLWFLVQYSFLIFPFPVETYGFKRSVFILYILFGFYFTKHNFTDEVREETCW